MGRRRNVGKFQFFNADTRAITEELSELFPDWRGQEEHLCVYSPHDDDAILGAGYAIRAAIEDGARVTIVIVCSGNAGYSTPEEKDAIVQTRHKETLACYEAFGVRAQDVLFLNYPDFSALSYMGWQLPSGGEGHFKTTIPELRKRGITRILAPNPYHEHVDHIAASMMASYDAPQAGDEILADWGEPHSVKSVAMYSVWADLDPEDAMLKHRPADIRGNCVLIADASVEQTVMKGILCYASQALVIKSLTAARKERMMPDGRYIEIYLKFDPRPKLMYEPYKKFIQQCASKKEA